MSAKDLQRFEVLTEVFGRAAKRSFSCDVVGDQRSPGEPVASPAAGTTSPTR